MDTQIGNHLRTEALMAVAIILCENAWDDENPVISASLGNRHVRQACKKYCYYCFLIIISVHNCIMDNEQGSNKVSFISFIFLELSLRWHSWLRISDIKTSVTLLKSSVLHNLGSTTQNCLSDMTGVETCLIIASPSTKIEELIVPFPYLNLSSF